MSNTKAAIFNAAKIQFVNLTASFDGDVMEHPPTSYTPTGVGYSISATGHFSASSNTEVYSKSMKSFADARALVTKTLPEYVNREKYIDAAERHLWKGADLMESVGWTTGRDCDDEGRVCLRGAVANQRQPQRTSFLYPAHRLALILVAEFLGLDPELDSPINWNDRQKTLGNEVGCKEVVETMRLAHDKSRRDRGLL